MNYVLVARSQATQHISVDAIYLPSSFFTCVWKNCVHASADAAREFPRGPGAPCTCSGA